MCILKVKSFYKDFYWIGEEGDDKNILSELTTKTNETLLGNSRFVSEHTFSTKYQINSRNQYNQKVDNVNLK